MLVRPFALISALLLMVTAGVTIRPSYGQPAIAADVVKDAEVNEHSHEAANYRVVDTYRYPSFEVVQIELSVLSHYSYLLISEGDCLVIDPGRDVQFYLDQCRQRDATIRGVYLTHSHADFVAGHMELASRLDVPIYISEKTGADFAHQKLGEGSEIKIGKAVLHVLETPGHTPDGTGGLVSTQQAPDKPLVLFSGDTLLIGSVGRPDLLGEGMAASTLASKMFDTWYGKLAKLPDTVQVLPTHGAGSLCGAHLSDDPTSTIGEQRISNPYLQYRDRGEFIAAILDDLPEAPQYFKHNAAMNRIGPELVDLNSGTLPWIEPTEPLDDAAKFYVADIRPAAAYAQGHVPNSVNIGIRGRFETWVGTMVPWDANLVLCGDSEEELTEALQRLHRIGYNGRCLLLDSWMSADKTLAKNRMIKPRALHTVMQKQESPVLVDVRLPAEWMALRIGATANIPLNKLPTDAKLLAKTQPLVTVCNSAYRSSMAVGLLQRQGYEDVSNLEGGGKAWIAAGLPVIQAKQTGAIEATARREIRLAERISAPELKRLLLDIPGTFELVDVRPATHFADYHLPDATNVDLAELLDNPAYLTGAGSLVVVDRDGSIAAMVGGILSQKTERTIKVLYGGVQAYWNEADTGAFAQPMHQPSETPKAPEAKDPSTAKPAVPTPPKRSAGC